MEYLTRTTCRPIKWHASARERSRSAIPDGALCLFEHARRLVSPACRRSTIGGVARPRRRSVGMSMVPEVICMPCVSSLVDVDLGLIGATNCRFSEVVPTGSRRCSTRLWLLPRRLYARTGAYRSCGPSSTHRSRPTGPGARAPRRDFGRSTRRSACQRSTSDS